MSAELGRAISIRIPSWLSPEAAATAGGAVLGSFSAGALTQVAANAVKATGWGRVGLSLLVGGFTSALGYIGIQKTSGILRYLSFGAFVGGLAFPFTMLVMQALKATPEQVGEKLYRSIKGLIGKRKGVAESTTEIGAPVYVEVEPVSVSEAKASERKLEEIHKPLLMATIE